MLDTVRHIETPEGVELTLPLAGPVVRAQAWLLDLLLKAAILWGAAFVLPFLGNAGMGFFLIFIFLLSWLYSVFFEVLRDGATPGKRIMDLRVVHDNGTPVGWSAAILRSIVGYVDMLPFCYGLGLAATLLHPEFKRLGDMAAGTVVVHADRRRRSAWESKGASAAPLVPLLPEEQRAVVEFAQRSAMLTPERKAELAGIAKALTTPGGDRAAQLLAQAGWIAGHR